jgi:hypothetical protein
VICSNFNFNILLLSGYVRLMSIEAVNYRIELGKIKTAAFGCLCYW